MGLLDKIFKDSVVGHFVRHKSCYGWSMFAAKKVSDPESPYDGMYLCRYFDEEKRMWDSLYFTKEELTVEEDD